MRATDTNIENLSLLGGQLCLDFVNTMDPRLGKHPREFLTSYVDLVRWAIHIGLLTADKAQPLLEQAAHRTADAKMVFEQAISLREAVFRIFLAIAHAGRPTGDDLHLLQSFFTAALAHAQLTPTAQHFQWMWKDQEHNLDGILWPVVHAAIELLTSPELHRVKECPGLGDCGWLFLDTSKNGSRQWCSMEGCGSRAKMRRHYARRRAENETHHAL